jgi:hypothetical protein
MGVQPLHGFGISIAELAHRLLVTFDHSVEVFYCGHLEITSIVLTPIPKALSAGILLFASQCVQRWFSEVRMPDPKACSSQFRLEVAKPCSFDGNRSCCDSCHNLMAPRGN